MIDDRRKGGLEIGRERNRQIGRRADRHIDTEMNDGHTDDVYMNGQIDD